MANGVLSVDTFRWGGEGNQLMLSGDVALGAEHPALNLDLAGMVDLRMLSAFAPDVATAGQARIQLAARGTTAKPDVNGQVALENVDTRLQEPRFVVTGLSGTIQLAGDRLTASGITGTANGGTLTLGADVSYPGFEFTDGSLTIVGRQLAMELTDGLESEVDADLTLALVSGDDPLLNGRVTIQSGAYREPLSLAGFALAGTSGDDVETIGLDEETALDRIRLDVAVVTAEDLAVDNNYGKANVGANVRLLGTVGQPGLSGRATIREGSQIFLAGNTYVIEQATVDFANQTRIEPDLNLRARTRVAGYGITLSVSGTPDVLEHSLQSDPPLPESDIVSLLVTGRTLAEAQGAQTEVAREQFLGYLSGDLLGFAGRAVGLDTFRLERGLAQDTQHTDLALFAGDEDPSSRLTISKNLSRNVEIVLSQNLSSSGGLTWIAMYRPTQPVELRTISRDDNTRAYEFRHTVQFGGGVSAEARSPEERPEPDVLDIRFAGDPGLDVRTLESALDLERGDRFDFFAWQGDRDRLETLFHERGYLEAEVKAARDPMENEENELGLALTYIVDRGPHTTLRVEGLAVPDSLLEEMRDSWGRTVFDGFLLEDFRETVQEYLAGEGYFRSSIQGEIVRPTPDEKQIVIRVDAGPRSVDYGITFLGNSELSSDQLLSALSSDAREAIWTRPEAVVELLERFYRSEGFLTANLSVGEPIFDGTTARRPVTVQEGPRFTIARVSLEGVTAIDEGSLRPIVNLQEGAVYRPAEAEAGRRRLDLEYRRQGFNSARSTVRANVDPDAATVTVVMTVNEGPQQILGEIVIAGADITRIGVVTSNLALEKGEPVDMTEWYRARRRLYDTNVFRSVELEVEPVDESADPVDKEVVRARVTLQEWPRYRFRYGFQLYDEVSPVAEQPREISPGIVADIQDRNLFGRAASTGLATRFQNDFRIGRVFLSTPTFFGLNVRSSVFVTRARQDLVPPFLEDTSGISLEQRFKARPTIEVAYSYRFERKRTFDPDPGPFDPFPDGIRVRVGRLTASTVVERRNDPFDATRGWFHSSTIEYGPEALWSDLRFVKYLAQGYYFHPVGPAETPVVFASAARLGLGRGFGQDLISSEKFFAGGANSVRGYAEDSLGEVDFFGDPRGGNAFVQVNQEIRFPVFRWVRGVGFIDAGNVFSAASELSLSGLRAGTGIGLRVQTPVALLRVDFATALSPRPGERRTRWYFSIGQAF
jgi:outer membrane protein insertion porin family